MTHARSGKWVKADGEGGQGEGGEEARGPGRWRAGRRMLKLSMGRPIPIHTHDTKYTQAHTLLSSTLQAHTESSAVFSASSSWSGLPLPLELFAALAKLNAGRTFALWRGEMGESADVGVAGGRVGEAGREVCLDGGPLPLPVAGALPRRQVPAPAFGPP